MTQSYYSLITNNGLLKEAAANSPGGSAIDLTHIAVGDANGTSYNPTGAQTALVNEVYRTTLTHVAIDEANPNQLIVEGVINETIGPFDIREVGIFDSEGQLFAIGKYPETFKSTSESGSGKRLYIRMILGFTNAPQVNLVMSEDLNNDPNFNANVIIALAEKLAKAENLADLEDAEEARANLGLEIGADVQAFAANLAALAALIGSAKKIPYFTAAGQMALSDLFSNKNVIINGDFNIWQRGAYFTSIVDGGYTADRWIYGKQGTVVHDITRSTDTPSIAQAGRGFNYSIFIDCQTADNSIASTDVAAIEQKIEGYNWLPLTQKAVTLSFWVKATKTGIYCVALRNNRAGGNTPDRSCVAEYAVNQADTWEYKTITFPASPSTGTWDYTNGCGASLSFILAAGTSFQTTENIWQTGNYFATSNQVNACDNTANDFRLCGVQLEAGSVATPFEQRLFQQELFLCQRYFEKSYEYSIAPGSSSANDGIVAFSNQNAQANKCSVYFKNIKRVIPSITLYSPNSGVAGKIYNTSSDLNAGIGNPGSYGFHAALSSTTTLSDLYFQWTANAEI